MTDGPPNTDALEAQVRAWIAIDPDPDTRAEAEQLLRLADAGDPAAETRLRDAFAGRLKFGTAGLRALMGAGPRRMNRLVVAQTSAGLAAFLLARRAQQEQSEQPDRQMNARTTASAPAHAAPGPRTDRDPHGTSSEPPTVVVGFDGRLNSDVFARDAAETFAGAGLDVLLLPESAPTPVLAFAVRRLGAAAGVMITASHNPPGDNGYKVYLGEDGSSEGDGSSTRSDGNAGGGRPVAPPQDREIAGWIERVLGEQGALPPRSERLRVAGAELLDAYVAATARAVGGPGAPALAAPRGTAPTPTPTPTVVYTAMHGVGGQTARRVFALAGLPGVIPVAEQDRPDGRFPTVDYPNPEEPDALDLAFALARERGADYVLAHDPDADRLALAASHPDAPGGYRRLSGNELGLLLGWRIAERERAAAEREGRAPRGTLANTIVSSPALGAVARAHGLDHAETLSGFKWVSRVPGLLFGFEEALGYLTDPEVVGDKDGISAAAEALAMACELYAGGRTVWDLLDEASERFGHFASAQIVLRRERVADVEALSAWVRANAPRGFAGRAVEQVRDFRRPGLAPVRANVLAYDLADGSRVMIRPSGTEPKLKVYLDAFSDRGTVAERRSATAAALGQIEVAVRAYLDGAGPEAAGARP